MNPPPRKRARHGRSFPMAESNHQYALPRHALNTEDRNSSRLRLSTVEPSAGFEGDAQHSGLANYPPTLPDHYSSATTQHNNSTADQEPPLGTGSALWDTMGIPSPSYFSTIDPSLDIDLDLSQEVEVLVAGDNPDNSSSQDSNPTNASQNARKTAIEQGRYPCTESDCPKKNPDGTPHRFGSQADLYRHAHEVHGKDLRTGGPAQKVYCPFPNCSRSKTGFSRKLNLEDHMRKVHEGQPPPGRGSPLSGPHYSETIVAISSRVGSSTTPTISQNATRLQLPDPLTEIEESDPVLFGNYHLAKSNRELIRIKEVEFEQQAGRYPEYNSQLVVLTTRATEIKKIIKELKQDRRDYPEGPASVRTCERLATKEEDLQKCEAELQLIKEKRNAFVQLKEEIRKYHEQANKGIHFVLLKRQGKSKRLKRATPHE